MATEPAGSEPRPDTGNPVRRWLRISAAAILTVAIVLLPAAGAAMSYAGFGEPPERDLVIGAMWVAAAMAALAWTGLGLFRIVSPMNRMAESAAVGGGRRIDDPELVRTFLAGHDFPCARCGYNLRGLPPGPCPECREPIVMHIAGADLFRPIVWLARLAVAACALCALRGVLGVWRGFQMWSYLPFSMPGRSMLRLRAALALPPLMTVVTLLVLGVAVASWMKADAGRPRGTARWRVLNVALGLLVLHGVTDVVVWALYR